TTKFNTALLGSQGVASAIICSLFASWFYRTVSGVKIFHHRIFTDGVDVILNSMIFSTLPACFTILLFTLCDLIVIKIFHVNCFHDIFIGIGTSIFGGMGRSYFSGLLFLILSTALWFVGIHGSNVFSRVADELFQSGIAVNVAAVQAGQAPTEIVTKSFLDTFVIMGGCGSTLCLMIAILLFSKRDNVRRLVNFAAVPAIFNINELLVFGLPIIFNRYFLIPFLTTPILLYTLAYLATSLGLVPVITKEIFWTTPVFFSGYIATGSVSGIIMQIVNLAAGVCLYMPFVRKFDKSKDAEKRQYLNHLVDILKESEKSAIPITLTNMRSTSGALAKSLAGELKSILAQRSFRMYYQPQFNNHHQLIGAEALLRWKHPDLGMMYPPLIVKLAGESDMKVDLEKYIFETVAAETVALKERTGYRGHVSVNVTVSTLKSQGFDKFLTELVEHYHLMPGDLCIEITEETELILDDTTISLIEQIRKMGFTFALDDFAMGHTSLKYLQTNQFAEVKLDGSIVIAMTENYNVKDIIDSI
ncbi:MAG: PTS sugar transporter subunit IIC/EAL domain-containing protein, partial [Spirochaetales bacterium]|nr:PTS sugar transporter subunit IIC/EAL domain-containing protein [Spirochaetales bacterium]